MKVESKASRFTESNNGNGNSKSAQNSGFTRLGYDKNGTLCVLDISFSDGTRRVFNKPGNSHSERKSTPEPDLATATFPVRETPSRPYPGPFARLGYDGGTMVVLECGSYRRNGRPGGGE